ncbi:MAG: hypothetical protein ACI92Z_000542 [Paracoccaceae bacterium]|jgi:hypothetical protein
MRGIIVKKTVLILALPINITACTSSEPASKNAEWNDLKARCLAQDYDACAEIAYSAKQPAIGA